MEQFEKLFDDDVKSVANAVRKYGFDLRVVGGAVRDFLLGKKPRDIDFATNADPAELILIFDLEGIAYDAKGISHGTVKAVFGDEKVDVTSITGSSAGGRDDSAGIHGQVCDIDTNASSGFFSIICDGYCTTIAHRKCIGLKTDIPGFTAGIASSYAVDRARIKAIAAFKTSVYRYILCFDGHIPSIADSVSRG